MTVALAACTGKDALNCEAAAPTENPNDDSDTFVNSVDDSNAGGLTVVTVALTAGAEVLTVIN